MDDNNGIITTTSNTNAGDDNNKDEEEEGEAEAEEELDYFSDSSDDGRSYKKFSSLSTVTSVKMGTMKFKRGLNNAEGAVDYEARAKSIAAFLKGKKENPSGGGAGEKKIDEDYASKSRAEKKERGCDDKDSVIMKTMDGVPRSLSQLRQQMNWNAASSEGGGGGGGGGGRGFAAAAGKMTSMAAVTSVTMGTVKMKKSIFSPENNKDHPRKQSNC